MPLTGPDVSHHQGRVDWPAVARAGHTYAWCKLTDGLAYRFVSWGRENLPQVRAAGLVPGAYHWLDAGPNGELHDPVGQARYFVAEIANAGGLGGLMCALDVEVERNTSGIISRPGIDSARLFAEEFARLTGGHPLVIYTGGWYWRGYIGNPTGVGLGALWHSEYETSQAEIDDGPELVNYGGWPGALFWQFTSSGSCPGVAGVCDLNQFFGDLPALLALTGAATPTPAPPVPEEPEMMMFQSKESGAVLLVTGGASVLITSNAEKDAHVAAGIPLLAVGHDQFRHYEALRANGDLAEPLDVAALGAAVGEALAAALPEGSVDVAAVVAGSVAGVRKALAEVAVNVGGTVELAGHLELAES
jgi:GH25 family lysozyme M1 (1,4-beta-N-acetylmuramidase)